MANDAVAHLACGDIEFGIWCDDCQTSGGMTIPLYYLGRHGVTLLATIQKCLRCGGYDDDGC